MARETKNAENSKGFGDRLRMRNPAGVILCCAIIILSLAMFGYRTIYQSTNEFLTTSAGARDLYWWYAAGEFWENGEDPYDYEAFTGRILEITGKDWPEVGGYYYPPQSSVLFSLLPNFSVATSYWILLSLNLVLTFGLLALMGYILSWFIPIGLLEVTFLISLLGTGIRTNIRFGQVSLFVAVPMFLAFILAYKNRKLLSGGMLSLLSFKPTFAPLYFLYFLRKREFKVFITAVLAVAALTFLPLLLTGRPVLDTIQGLADMRSIQRGQFDDPSPFFIYSATQYHLEPLIFRILNAESQAGTLLTWIILLILGAITFALMMAKEGEPGEALLDFGLVSSLSLLAIYHRSYDIFLLFPGMLYLYLQIAKSEDGRRKQFWGLFLVGMVVIFILPSDWSRKIAKVFPTLPDYYLWRVIAPLHAWANLAFFSVLLWFKVRLQKRNRSTPLPP